MSEPNSNQPGNQESVTPPQQPQPARAAKPSTSGLAISGLVVGIIALLTSFLPIVNNASFFLAIIGVVLSIVGLVGIGKGKHSGKGIAIAGIVLGVLSIVAVLATQALFSAALDTAKSELNASSTPVPAASASASSATSGSAESSAQAEVDYQNLHVGEAVNMKSGLSITVNSIEGGLSNYDGSEIVCVNVTYANSGTKNESFNLYDWKAEDDSGALRTTTFYMNAENQLNSGQLSAGGQVTGNIYFDAPVTKVHYYGNIVENSSTAAWVA